MPAGSDLLPRDNPGPNHHAAYALDHLGGAFAARFLLQELLRHVQLRPRVLLVRRNWLREAAREVCPPLAQMPGNGNRVDHVTVLKGIQQGTAPCERVIDLLGRARFVIVQRQEVSDRAPEIQRPLRQLIGQQRRVGRWFPGWKLRQRVRVQVFSRDHRLNDIQPLGSSQKIEFWLSSRGDIHHMATQSHGAPDDRRFEALQPRQHIGIAQVGIIERIDQRRVLSHELRVGQKMCQCLLLEPPSLEELVNGGGVCRQEDRLNFFQTVWREGRNRVRGRGWNAA